ncbi:hypothetical protein Aph01nite_36740 [Acrocarpospora phusangensis]|uniref:Uncharacterized protein n=1 Tax=Acrocarpospora phusangensis TaxID=1070424 RepID=A0A919QA57_9ACTN|nr:hypothetical protein Aph01nite_36740 [Acrocarpospora phusangensis]
MSSGRVFGSGSMSGFGCGAARSVATVMGYLAVVGETGYATVTYAIVSKEALSCDCMEHDR